jgi:hypothetical protein
LFLEVVFRTKLKLKNETFVLADPTIIKRLDLFQVNPPISIVCTDPTQTNLPAFLILLDGPHAEASSFAAQS